MRAESCARRFCVWRFRFPRNHGQTKKKLRILIANAFGRIIEAKVEEFYAWAMARGKPLRLVLIGSSPILTGVERAVFCCSFFSPVAAPGPGQMALRPRSRNSEIHEALAVR